jgi:hypothetical protein
MRRYTISRGDLFKYGTQFEKHACSILSVVSHQTQNIIKISVYSLPGPMTYLHFPSQNSSCFVPCTLSQPHWVSRSPLKKLRFSQTWCAHFLDALPTSLQMPALLSGFCYPVAMASALAASAAILHHCVFPITLITAWIGAFILPIPSWVHTSDVCHTHIGTHRASSRRDRNLPVLYPTVI